MKLINEKKLITLIILVILFPVWAYIQVPGQKFYKDRRERFMLAMDGGIAIFPGIYFHPEMLESLENQFGKKVPSEELQAFAEEVKPAFERFKNIGGRIEDIALITEDGCDVLSKDAPKEPKEIESLMKKKSFLNR